MGVMVQPWILVVFISVIPLFSCQQPLNIETFYPFETPSPAPAPSPLPPSLTPTNSPPQQPPPPQPAPQPESSTNNKTIVKAVAGTAASTIVVAALFFFLLQRFVIAKRNKARVGASSPGGPPPPPLPVVPRYELARLDGNLKGLIVDENGLDVLYWRKLEGENQRNSYRKEVYCSPKDEEEEEKGVIYKAYQSRKPEPIQEIPLLRGKSSTSHIKTGPEEDAQIQIIITNPSVGTSLEAVEKQKPTIQSSNASTPPPPPLPPPPTPSHISSAIPKKKSPAPPPPPPTPSHISSAIQNKKSPAPPPPPPIPAKKSPAPPPPPPKPGGLATSLKPPPLPKGTPSGSKSAESSAGEGRTGNRNGQVKLKPLHWDKVNPNNADHSMVWDKIDNGSFR